MMLSEALAHFGDPMVLEMLKKLKPFFPLESGTILARFLFQTGKN